MAVVKKFGPPLKQQTYLTKILSSNISASKIWKVSSWLHTFLISNSTWFTEKNWSSWCQGVVLNKRGLVCVCVCCLVEIYSSRVWCMCADLSNCGGEANCIGSEGVLRLSLGCFVSSSWLSLDGLLSWMTSTPSVKLITISADLLPISNHFKDCLNCMSHVRLLKIAFVVSKKILDKSSCRYFSSQCIWLQ